MNQNFFSSASARSKVAKAVLYPRAFSRKCLFCLTESKDILSHQLFSCIKVEKHTKVLRCKLVLYNFPANKLMDCENF